MKEAYKASFTHSNISSGFQKAGIVPFVPMCTLPKCNDWDPIKFQKYVPDVFNLIHQFPKYTGR